MPNFHKQKSQFLGAVLEKIQAAVYKPAGDLTVTAFVTAEPLPFAQREQGRRLDLQSGDKWASEIFDSAWFHFTGLGPDNGNQG